MINLESGVRCNKQAIERHLTDWGVDWRPLSILIKKGTWTLGSFGSWNSAANDPSVIVIRAYDSNWYYLLGGTSASWMKKLLARLLGRGMTKDTALADLAISKVIYHEWCHTKGIDECRNNDKTKRYSCIMYENLWYQEIAAMPLQAMRKFTLCDDCKKRLNHVI